MAQEQYSLSSGSVAELITRIETLRPRLGDTVLVAIDGRSCSGKTTLAQTLEQACDATVVHLEYLYHGWDGLAAGVQTAVTDVLAPISRGESAQVPQWDWYEGGWGQPRKLAPPRLLILEGVGAASSAVRAHASLTVWLEVPESDRRARAVARDWDTFADHWDDWAKQEAALMEREQLVSAVDLVLSGVDATVSDPS